MKVRSLLALLLISFVFIILLSPQLAGADPESKHDLMTMVADEHRKIWNMEFVSQIGGRSRHVEAHGTYVYVSIGPRVVVFDVSSPDVPAVVDQTAMFPDRITDIFLTDSYMYVTWSYGNYGGLRVYDISDPAAPALVADHFMPDHPAVGIHVLGNYAYLLASADIDLRILDISDPTAPVEVAVYWPAGWPNEIDVRDGYAYIAGDYAGLRVIDISDPYAPVEVGWWVPPDRFRNRLVSVRVVGHIAYVSDGNDLWVLDVSEPGQPRQIGELLGTGGKIHRVGDLLFLSGWGEGWGRGVFIVDVADPTTPSVTGSYATPGGATDVDTSGDYVFVADASRGFRIADITDLTAPIELSAYEVPTQGHDVKIQGHYAYVTDEDGLYIIDISDPSKPAAAGFSHMPTEALGQNIGVVGVDVLGQYAYVATRDVEDGNNSLRIIDVSDSTAPREIGAYDQLANVRDLDVVRDPDTSSIYAYVVTRDYPTSSLHVVDVSDLAAPAEIASHEWEGPGFSVQVLGHYAYIASHGLRIINISNPAEPVEVGLYETRGYIGDVFVGEDPTAETGTILAYVVEAGLKIIDVSDPASPTLVGATQPMSFDSVYVAGHYAYVTSYLFRALRVFDVSNPAAPVEIGAHRTRGYAREVYVAGGYTYVTEFEEALRIFRLVPTASAPIPSEGGTLDSPADGTRYTFPAGAFSDTVTANHVVPAPGDVPYTAPFTNIGHVFVVSGVYADTGQPTHPTRPYTVTVHYTDAKRGPAIEDTLALYRWDGVQWMREPTSVVDTEANAVTATPAQFGLWAVLGETRRMYLPAILRSR